VEIPTSFIFTIYNEEFKYGDGAKFEVMLEETLSHYVKNSAILCNAVT
jgi:hypothetical protein